MKESVLKVLVLFSSLHYVVSQVIPSVYLPHELVQWTNEIESFIKTGFVKPRAYTFGDAQCALSKSHYNYILKKISPKLHDIWNDLKAKYQIYLNRHNSLDYVAHSNKNRIDDKMKEVRQAFEGLMKRLPADNSHDKNDLCSYALSQLTGDTLKNKIDSMRREIIDQDGSDVFSAIVARFKPPNTNGCNVTYTDSEFIYSIHSELMSMEVGGYITMVFSYWYLSKYDGENGYINYIELEGVIQTVALPDAGGKCEEIDMQGVDWTKYCEPYPNNHHCLGIERPCLGHISGCKRRDAGEVCIDNFSSSRRYKWIAPQKNIVTTSQTCSGENLFQMSWKGRANNCICLCVDNDPDSMSTHIFHLQRVEADVNENKVVTGVRVLVDHGVVHLQIKQGILGHDWRVEGSTWKEINDISEEIYAHRIGKKLHGKKPEVTENVDYYVVSYPLRFDIDELNVPANHVLTVKFHYGKDQRLQIALLTREFNPATGKLTISSDANIVTGRQGRRWDHYGGWMMDNPFKNMDNYETHNIHGIGYLVFTETMWFDGDSGQTIVPFFDPRIAESNPPTAIGGFGFTWRAGNNYGFGLLSPVLYSLDYATYIKDSSDRLKN